ncbi:MAG: hypothetical protein HYV09_29335 [Deltaproteobacteria bacterium]|nr:hypothetical protein [Deltaproteobacteria bacterium]
MLIAVAVLGVACGKAGPTIAEAEAALKGAAVAKEKITCSIRFRDNWPVLSSIGDPGMGYLTTFCRFGETPGDPNPDPLQRCFGALTACGAATSVGTSRPLCLALKDAGALKKNEPALMGLAEVPCGTYDDVVVERVEPSSADQATVSFEVRPGQSAFEALKTCGDLELPQPIKKSAILRKVDGKWVVR